MFIYRFFGLTILISVLPEAVIGKVNYDQITSQKDCQMQQPNISEIRLVLLDAERI